MAEKDAVGAEHRENMVRQLISLYTFMFLMIVNAQRHNTGLYTMQWMLLWGYIYIWRHIDENRQQWIPIYLSLVLVKRIASPFILKLSDLNTSICVEATTQYKIMLWCCLWTWFMDGIWEYVSHPNTKNPNLKLIYTLEGEMRLLQPIILKNVLA